MSHNPELDQVTEMRRKLATHALFPLSYWIVYSVLLVVIMSIPVWVSALPSVTPYLTLGLLVVALGSAMYSIRTRRRSGVALPRRITAYPGARRLHAGVLALTVVGVIAGYALVGADRPGIAMAVLVPLAALVLAGQYRIRQKMAEDIATGRVEQ
ncbi:hypothetical protein [Pseudonocardia sp. ICBG1293]|uniref:hypothetical protein n=1 Tax=Pseudonocardia sp. ICBG1293 TaxID=2844382 RepID=UPI001CCB8A29|nr:hypothetical protein [Pseudonocardia sp. ICBG1293]